MGGGGGAAGGAGGAAVSAAGGGGGAGTVGELTGDAEAAAPLSPAADRGRGGAIVPNKIEASCAALVPPGRSSSESSSSSSLSEPHPSSVSARLREMGPADGAGAAVAAAGAADCAAKRWNGLFDTSGWAAGGAGGGAVL